MKYFNIFETERLVIREFNHTDNDYFFDLMGNSKVMNPIPLAALTQEESNKKLIELIALYKLKSQKKIWAITLKNSIELIGLCGLIINNENENEIAYRLREKFWGNGYGTEIAKGLINYGFEKLNFELITADVSVSNKKSIIILEKYMVFDKEFYNPIDKCRDRRYKISKVNWSQKKFS